MSEPAIWDLLERDHEAVGAQLAKLQAAPKARRAGCCRRSCAS
ncbi:hypothetical protein OV079_04150 [Nannocystis pusilla]|uniref:Uncharacterized protein n=1 Tax=Nannocystis pusilla TaxID=889268 RepID=A0A9X3EIP0_9BACT|nr:hypothetical protein [Nannocystis pusilla]MCY1004777.1 hypothetical protein [Nannocystis pusilla]